MAVASIGETVNFVIDNLLSTAQRLLDLPLSVLLAAAGAAALLLTLLAARLRARGRVRSGRALHVATFTLLALATVFVFDYRVAQLQEQIERVRARSDQSATALVEALNRIPGHRRDLLFDRAAAEAALGQRFGSVRLRALCCDAATDLVQVHLDNPLLEAWLAIVDLRHRDLELILDGRLDVKTLTSDFARTHTCSIAVNGEAGMSAQPDCGLGKWRGNLMVREQTLLREEPGRPLPFLAFDRDNRAFFTSGRAADRTVPASAFNVIWGRVDVVVDGVVETADFRFNQPRTAMGIDATGSKLFLLVADGRQARRSWGLTRPEAGHFLRAFGVVNAMLCDEGGSSCMYVAILGGIANVPSDNEGQERPTYTHFGLALRDPADRRDR